MVRVLTAGGFTLNDDVLQRMQDLTGYQFQIVTANESVSDELVVVEIVNGSGERVAINYQTERYHDHVAVILFVTIAFVLSGVVIFIPVAWFIARRFARPLETLSLHAKTIGSGEWGQGIEVKGASEIESLSAALEQMRLQLNQLDSDNRKAERLATVGTFTATIAHEVRNPLAAVKIMLQLIHKDHADERIDHILNEIERLDLMVDELLGFSAGMEVQLAPCALESVASEVQRLLQRQADHADVSIEITGAAEVMADERRLRQLLLNLCLNAIQAQHDGDGYVKIEVCKDGLLVKDGGPGVPEDLLPELFTAFSSRREQGTGLGYI